MVVKIDLGGQGQPEVVCADLTKGGVEWLKDRGGSFLYDEVGGLETVRS